MAEYICNINPEIFIYDYDHNAPTKEHLENYRFLLQMQFDKKGNVELAEEIFYVATLNNAYDCYKRLSDLTEGNNESIRIKHEK